MSSVATIASEGPTGDGEGIAAVPGGLARNSAPPVSSTTPMLPNAPQRPGWGAIAPPRQDAKRQGMINTVVARSLSTARRWLRRHSAAQQQGPDGTAVAPLANPFGNAPAQALKSSAGPRRRGKRIAIWNSVSEAEGDTDREVGRSHR